MFILILNFCHVIKDRHMDTQTHPYIFSINDDYHDNPNIIHKKTINLSMKNVP